MKSAASAPVDDPSFRSMAAIAAIVSMPLAIGNLVAMLVAAGGDLDALTDPLILLHIGPAGAEWWRWSMILDLFGYYLLIVPLTLLLRDRLRHRGRNWIDLFTACLLAYSLIGSIGATILATVTPSMIANYAGASASQKAVLAIVSGSYSDAIYRGLWNLLEECLAGVGWLGLGIFLRGELPGSGWIAILLGAACLVDSAGTILNLDAVSMLGLVPYLVLAPIWALWTGVSLLRTNVANNVHVGA